MKVKTSITISKHLLKEIDSSIPRSGNRSHFIEEAVRTYLSGKKRSTRNQKDIEIINRSSKELNEESDDILSYQVKI